MRFDVAKIERVPFFLSHSVVLLRGSAELLVINY